VRFVRYPNIMPAYTTELLSDDELRSIYEYLRSIPEPPPIEDIPALNAL
jgi:mono/diheme cytochrome c family protein